MAGGDDNTIVEGGGRDYSFQCFLSGSGDWGADHKHSLLVLFRSAFEDGKLPASSCFILFLYSSDVNVGLKPKQSRAH